MKKSPNIFVHKIQSIKTQFSNITFLLGLALLNVFLFSSSQTTAQEHPNITKLKKQSAEFKPTSPNSKSNLPNSSLKLLK